MKKTTLLAQDWQFRALAYVGSEPDGESHIQNLQQWLPAEVPGTVQTDLLRLKMIEDPYYRDRERALLWIEDVKWEYRTTFEIDANDLQNDRLTLVFVGLDTFAAIYVNEQLVAKSENMFVELRVEVKKYLKPGANELRLEFDSATQIANLLEERHGYLHGAFEVQGKAYIRKAQYAYGWDWGPRVAAIGIWRPVFLEMANTARIEAVFFKPFEITAAEAIADVEVEVERLAVENLAVAASLTFASQSFCQTLPCLGDGKISKVVFRFSIPEPHLWWPNGYGDQPLYNLQVQIKQTEQVIDQFDDQVGIRSIDLRQVEDEEGLSFTLQVNGKPIYCKGADWVPVDTLIPRFGEQNYCKLLQLAADANMTMLRVWGGGIYEEEVFYRTCDRLGILIWQDFMFACALYPEHDWFLQLLQEEFPKIIKRLRNRACIALWCGNNENDWIYQFRWRGKTDRFHGESIYHHLLPEYCARYDGTRPYWPSSPFGGEEPNDEKVGDRHNWTVWSFWQDYSAYAQDRSRFMSEFGFQAMANYHTWFSYTEPADRRPQSRMMEHFQRQNDGTAKIYRYLGDHYKLSTEFHEFIYLTQLMQAEALRFGVEHWRIRKFKTSGALIWQLNDCWPACSWSMIDYHLQPKAAYYYARRFFAPVLVAFKQVGDGYEVWGVNDSFELHSGELHLRLLNLAGATVWETKQIGEISKNASNRLLSVKCDDLPSFDPYNHFLHLDWRESGKLLIKNSLFLVKLRLIDFLKPNIQLQWRQAENDRVILTLSADVVVKNLYLFHPQPGFSFSDNFMDVLPACPIEIEMTGPNKISAKEISELKWFYLQ